MDLPTVNFCPFTDQPRKCVDMVDNKVHRCTLLKTYMVSNAVTGENKSVDDCAFNWMVSLQLEGNQHALGTGQAVESLRNESVLGFVKLLGQGAKSLG